MNSNEDDASPNETKTIVDRCQQCHQFTQITMPQPLHQATTMENDAKQKTTSQPTNARQTKRFEGKCFYCDKFGHRRAECRQKARDAENRTLRTRDQQKASEDCLQKITKNMYAIFEDTQATPPNTAIGEKNASPYQQIPNEKKNARRNTKPETRDERNNEACAQDQPTYRSWGFDGQPEYENEHEDDKPLN